ncbi:MAG: hypothetical protein QOE52_3075 [Mycobacterium sp.]|jgi:hypothetical protein|nr:hypothetical protein [Mycobacterium sp.]MDT5343891.1 hypothetical protein [Mycobacterium sp.]
MAARWRPRPTTDRPTFNRHRESAQSGPAVRDPVDPAALVGRDRAGLVSLVGLAARDLVGLEDMNLVGLEGTNLVGLEGMDRAVRASLGVLAALATLGVRGLVDPEDMNRVDLEDQAERDQKGRDPQDLEARALNQDQTQVDLMRMVLDRAQPGLMPAHLDRTPAHLDRTRPADRPREPTTRAEATRPEARTHLVEATRRAEAIRRVRAEAIRQVRVTDSSRSARIRGAG